MAGVHAIMDHRGVGFSLFFCFFIGTIQNDRKSFLFDWKLEISIENVIYYVRKYAGRVHVNEKSVLTYT